MPNPNFTRFLSLSLCLVGMAGAASAQLLPMPGNNLKLEVVTESEQVDGFMASSVVITDGEEDGFELRGNPDGRWRVLATDAGELEFRPMYQNDVGATLYAYPKNTIARGGLEAFVRARAAEIDRRYGASQGLEFVRSENGKIDIKPSPIVEKRVYYRANGETEEVEKKLPRTIFQVTYFEITYTLQGDAGQKFSEIFCQLGDYDVILNFESPVAEYDRFYELLTGYLNNYHGKPDLSEAWDQTIVEGPPAPNF